MDSTLLIVTLAAAAAELRVPRAVPPRVALPSSLSDLEALSNFQSMFRLSQAEFTAIHTALRLPEAIVSAERDSMDSELALLLVLGYLGGSRLASLARTFGRSEAACSRLCIKTIEVIDVEWAHLLDITRAHQGLLGPTRLRRYSDALAGHGERGSPLPGL